MTSGEASSRRTRRPPLRAAWRAVQSPFWVARIVFLVGAVTLASALLPDIRERTELITEILPRVFPAAATTGAAAVGIILIALSRALRRAKFRAWLLATVLTAAAVVLHLVKGLDVEEAVLSAGLLVVLVAARDQFDARPDPRSTGRVVGVLLAGSLIAAVLGWMWLNLDVDSQAPGTTQRDRLLHAVLGMVGITGPVRFVDPADGDRAAVALVVLGASALLVAVLTALQPAGGPHPLSTTERARVRSLVEQWGSIDSLAFFALRDDRSVIFSRTGKAAVSYRVVGSVSLAAGDPLGDPEAWPGAITAWLDEARSFGWTPAVLAASERGAEAFHRARLDALELGDEAVLESGRFCLAGRSMRSVRQAVARCERAGLRVTVRRVGELTQQELQEVIEHAERWRDGPVERGFSMALGRVGGDDATQCVLVRCRSADGQLRGLLHLVPWGATGLSLDLMRRDRDTENGIVEQMVSDLMAEVPDLGVRWVSLNFAVFRSVFARGERLGAGPVLRWWRSTLLLASRFWQIESLYRANAKYQPEWRPRYVCFQSSAELPRVGLAMMRAEAFVVPPAWWTRLRGR